ncbi:MAG: hypothetical protein MUF71_13510 [Candidatus Kapabacteria bacterium]|nr:hypothetical protein [Candidatus Kapabacteria bacterium]
MDHRLPNQAPSGGNAIDLAYHCLDRYFLAEVVCKRLPEFTMWECRCVQTFYLFRCIKER